MKYATVVLMLSVLALAPACAKSEVDQKPAAQVTDSPTAASTTAATDTQQPAATTAARVIREKSRIGFVAAKVTRDHQGEFKNFDGTIEYAGGKPVKVAFDIDMNSVETDTEKLTGHLKTADFFNVAQYPKATFVSSSLIDAPPGSPAGATHMLTGKLMLHGIEKDVTIPVKAEVTAGGVRTTSEFTINRQDWGISYKGAPDDLVRDEVLMKLDLAFPPPPGA